MIAWLLIALLFGLTVYVYARWWKERSRHGHRVIYGIHHQFIERWL